MKTGDRFPERCGVLGDDMPDGFVKQQLLPFRGSTRPAELAL